MDGNKHKIGREKRKERNKACDNVNCYSMHVHVHCLVYLLVVGSLARSCIKNSGSLVSMSYVTLLSMGGRGAPLSDGL